MTGSEAVPKPAPPKPPVADQKVKTPFVRQPHLTHRPFAGNKDLKDLKTFLRGTTKAPSRRRKGKKA